ncbi:hypothetical protein [Nocardia sp. NPDC049526]|uniref:hypothetical protein n=1 Tax=Nocardia sp. NPDC049526 TaxID=3364316 RepID=UPI00379845C8
MVIQQAVISRAAAEAPARAPAGPTTEVGATGSEGVVRPAMWSGGPVGELIAEHIGALHVTHSTIANPQSAEFAARVGNGTRTGRWRLSWLPEMALTRTQAISAMVLERILITHDLDSATMLRVMSLLAADLRMPLHQLLVRLSSHQERAGAPLRGGSATCARSAIEVSIPPRGCRG